MSLIGLKSKTIIFIVYPILPFWPVVVSLHRFLGPKDTTPVVSDSCLAFWFTMLQTRLILHVFLHSWNQPFFHRSLCRLLEIVFKYHNLVYGWSLLLFFVGCRENIPWIHTYVSKLYLGIQGFIFNLFDFVCIYFSNDENGTLNINFMTNLRLWKQFIIFK